MKKLFIAFIFLSFCSGSINADLNNEEKIIWCNTQVKQSFLEGRGVNHYGIAKFNTLENIDYFLIELIISKNIEDNPWLEEKILDVMYLNGREFNPEDSTFKEGNKNSIYITVRNYSDELLEHNGNLFRVTDKGISVELNFNSTNQELCFDWYKLANT